MKYGFTNRQVIVWVMALMLFLLHQIFVFLLKIKIGLADSYLDPFLLPLIVYPLMLFQFRLLKNDYNYRLSLPLLIALTVGFSLVSELIFPALSTRFTADLFDVVMILLGSFVWYLFFQKAYVPNEETC